MRARLSIHPRSIGRLALAVTILVVAACGGGSSRSGVATPPAGFELVAGGTLPPGSALFHLALHGRHHATAAVNGFGTTAFNGLVRFDPVGGVARDPVALPASLDFTALAPGSTPRDSEGGLVFAETPTFPGMSVERGGKLFVPLSNLDPVTYAYNPGALLVYDVVGDVLHGPRPLLLATGTQALTAFFYNPSTLIAAADPRTGAERLVVVCGDNPFAFLGTRRAAVLVIDPAAEAVVEVIELGPTALAAGEVAITAAGKLYVGSALEAAIFEVDLAATPATATRGLASPIRLPSDADINQVPALVLSRDERHLYALSSNDASVFALDRADGFRVVARSTAFRRSVTDRTQASGGAFASQPLTMALSPDGTTLAVGTILIAQADQVRAGVRTAVDGVRLGSDGRFAETRLNALTAPFTPGKDIQHLAQTSELSGYLFIGESQTGKVHVARWGDL